MKKFKVTRTWYIDAKDGATAADMTSDRTANEEGGRGFWGIDVKHLADVLIKLFEKAQERMLKELNYAANEIGYNPKIIQPVVRQ